MIEIKEVKTKKDLRRFAKYPLQLYKDCPYYVPSLRSDEINTFNPKKNFSLKECDVKGFLAYKDGKLVGRIAGLINYTDNKIRNRNTIRFSRFECVDDIEVFKALIGAVEEFGREKGMEVIHGPWGFNDTDREGMLTWGFDKRSTYATNYYFPYFYQNMEKLGFSDESKWLERRVYVPKQVDEKITKFSHLLRNKYNLTDVSETMSVRQILKKYGDKMFDTLNESYGHLDGYVPIVGKARKNVLKQFATIVNTKYISFLVDENENVAAFIIALPSIANSLIKHKGKLFPFGFIDVLKDIKKPKELEMSLIGIRHEYKNSGIVVISIEKIVKSFIENGFEVVDANPMLEDNHAIQSQWKIFETEVSKKRQTYIKPIELLEEA